MIIIYDFIVLLEKGNRFIITGHTSNLTHLAFQYSFIRDVGKSKILLLAIRASYANSHYKKRTVKGFLFPFISTVPNLTVYNHCPVS